MKIKQKEKDIIMDKCKYYIENWDKYTNKKFDDFLKWSVEKNDDIIDVIIDIVSHFKEYQSNSFLKSDKEYYEKVHQQEKENMRVNNLCNIISKYG